MLMHEPGEVVAAGEGGFAGQHAVVVAGIGADVLVVKDAVEVHVEVLILGVVLRSHLVPVADVADAGQQPLDRQQGGVVAAAVAGVVDDDVLDRRILRGALQAGEDGADGLPGFAVLIVLGDQGTLARAGIEGLPAVVVHGEMVKADDGGVAQLGVVIAVVEGFAGLPALGLAPVHAVAELVVGSAVLLVHYVIHDAARQLQIVKLYHIGADAGMAAVKEQAVVKMAQARVEVQEIGGEQLFLDLGVLCGENLIQGLVHQIIVDELLAGLAVPQIQAQAELVIGVLRQILGAIRLHGGEVIRVVLHGVVRLD